MTVFGLDYVDRIGRPVVYELAAKGEDRVKN